MPISSNCSIYRKRYFGGKTPMNRAFANPRSSQQGQPKLRVLNCSTRDERWIGKHSDEGVTRLSRVCRYTLSMAVIGVWRAYGFQEDMDIRVG